MSRLSASPGVIGVAVAAGVGCWWLGLAALSGTGQAYRDLAQLSVQAAFVLVLAQWLAIAVFAVRWFPSAPLAGTGGMRSRLASCLAAALAVAAPGWPLLALLWHTSNLSAATLIGSQALAVLLAVTLALPCSAPWPGGRDNTAGQGAIGEGPVGDALRFRNREHAIGEGPVGDILRSAAGIAAAALVWMYRADLQAWIEP